MKEKNDTFDWFKKTQSESSISRRDYFAGLAMQIFIANNVYPINTHEMSDFCVNLADALIKRLDEAKDV